MFKQEILEKEITSYGKKEVETLETFQKTLKCPTCHVKGHLHNSGKGGNDNAGGFKKIQVICKAPNKGTINGICGSKKRLEEVLNASGKVALLSEFTTLYGKLKVLNREVKQEKEKKLKTSKIIRLDSDPNSSPVKMNVDVETEDDMEVVLDKDVEFDDLDNELETNDMETVIENIELESMTNETVKDDEQPMQQVSVETRVLMMEQKLEVVLQERDEWTKERNALIKKFQEEKDEWMLEKEKLLKMIQNNNIDKEKEELLKEVDDLKKTLKKLSNNDVTSEKLKKETNDSTEKMGTLNGPKKSIHYECNSKKSWANVATIKENEKKKFKNFALKALAPRTDPLEFSRIHFKINSSKQLKSCKPQDKMKMIYEILNTMEIRNYVFLASKIGNSIIEIYLRKDKRDEVRAAIKKHNLELFDDFNLESKFEASKMKDVNELIAKRLAFLYKKATLQNLRICILNGLSEEMQNMVKSMNVAEQQ